jgi:hypothetical protein
MSVSFLTMQQCGKGEVYRNPDGCESLFLGRALASMHSKRVGLHALRGSMYLPVFSVAQMQRTCHVSAGTYPKFGDQIDHRSRQSVTSLAPHAIGCIAHCPSLFGLLCADRVDHRGHLEGRWESLLNALFTGETRNGRSNPEASDWEQLPRVNPCKTAWGSSAALFGVRLCWQPAPGL